MASGQVLPFRTLFGRAVVTATAASALPRIAAPPPGTRAILAERHRAIRLANIRLDKTCSNKYTAIMTNTGRQSSDKTRRFDSPEQETFLNLWRTYDRLRTFEDELFGKWDLTPQQYNALRLLRGSQPRTLPTLALAARLVSRAPDITRLLDKLEESGLIERERLAANRRVVQVGITRKGLALLAQLDGEVRSCHARQLGHLSRTELRALTDLLRAARRPHETPEGEW
jgi:DNA-binding MarR family transcriptional regulator